MTYTQATPMREAFGAALVELGKKNPRVVALCADLTDAIKLTQFKENFPERFYQMGIKEADMIGTAAGMAIDGLIPFAATFAIFATSLANQAVRLSVGYNEANVKIVTSHGGVCVGADGATHQAFEDVALMRMIPGMTVLVPCDAHEAWKATMAAAGLDGPVYLRLGRIASPIVTSESAPFVIGKGQVLRPGNDVAVVAMGMMVPEAMKAADQLAEEGLSVRVINMSTVKPLDTEILTATAKECGCLVTVEEHSVLGGLGSACAEYLTQEYPIRVARVGVLDTFGESGEPAEILKKYKLDTETIITTIKNVFSQKRRMS
ncbi:transketolase [Candidatus Vecturithrix granuli]|uniref:Transketolase n=1 Tax=Vecturithrix granuli TaxID=1499967 RepID=A0A081C2I7_VECG1|nr:transketolase [Candidatus Vecturithrix granuli]